METIESKVGFWKNVKKSAAIALVGLSLGGGFGTVANKIYHDIKGETYLVMNKAELERLNNAVDFYEDAKNQYLKEKAKETLYEIDKNKDGYITREEAGIPLRER
jgi:hypothetical protein